MGLLPKKRVPLWPADTEEKLLGEDAFILMLA